MTNDIPPLPAGFSLEVPPLPQGFAIDNDPATPPSDRHVWVGQWGGAGQWMTPEEHIAQMRNEAVDQYAKERNANAGGAEQNSRAFARHFFFGRGPEVTSAMGAMDGTNPHDFGMEADIQRRQNDLWAKEHPYQNFAASVGGGIAGTVPAVAALAAAPIVGPAVAAASNVLARIPAVTSGGRAAAAAATAAGNAVPVTAGRAAATAGLIGMPIGASERTANDGVTPGNVALGAVEGAVGSALGSPVVQGVGRAIGDYAAPAARKLIDQWSAKLTPGETVGGWVQGLEQKASSLPVVGDFVRGVAERSKANFNRITGNRVLEPYGEQLPKNVQPGHQTADYLSDQISGKYQSLVPHLKMKPSLVQSGSGLDIRINGGYGQPGTPRAGQIVTPGIYQEAESLGASDQTLGRIEQASKELFKTLQNTKVQNGYIRGQAIKDSQSRLSETARELSSSSSLDDNRAAYFVRRIRDEFHQTMDIDNAALAPELAKANRAYAGLQIIRNAIVRGTGDEGAYTIPQFSAAVKKGDSSPGKRDYANGKAMFQDISAPARDTYRTYPDSGTSGREQTWRLAAHTLPVALGLAPATGGASLAPLAIAAPVPLATSSIAQALVRNSLAPRSSPDIAQWIARQTGSPAALRAAGRMPSPLAIRNALSNAVMNQAPRYAAPVIGSQYRGSEPNRNALNGGR